MRSSEKTTRSLTRPAAARESSGTAATSSPVMSMPAVTNGTAALLDSTKGGGEPLPDRTRSWMEQRFQNNFGQVRIHTDAPAVQLSRDLQANAFTYGQDIYFNAGKFAPDTREGQHLLAHELTHVVQQGQGAQIQRQPQQKTPVQKEEQLKTRKALDAEAKFWQDLHQWFPDDGRKLAGTGYDDAIDYLSASFDTNTGDPQVTRSVPIMNVGKKYLDEKDDNIRQTAIKAELDKVDAYRFDNALIDDEDMKNSTITGKIDALSVFQKRDYVAKLGMQTNVANKKMWEFIRRKLPSTPVADDGKANASGGVDYQFQNIKIVLLPDDYDSSKADDDGGLTSIDRTDTSTFMSAPGFRSKGGKITSFDPTPVPMLVYTIQTHYGVKSGPDATSGYGVGTRPEDAADRTLRKHEGTHGLTFINFIRNNIAANAFPVFSGQVGDDVAAFQAKINAYTPKEKAFEKLLSDALDASIQEVDCVGKTIEQFKAERKETTKVKCRKK
ncbi:eCIS core domain-containing protein [Chitinophaga vietnamensis]|uniref:eCIS core domain-containing protein n=1 Tax=Chitinophaga vietnamensis TaxID=2593957 RepID=UPI001177DC41|nr:DUF4157 domain-containing protein [Chitinophaga vietnamensis]